MTCESHAVVPLISFKYTLVPIYWYENAIVTYSYPNIYNQNICRATKAGIKVESGTDYELVHT